MFNPRILLIACVLGLSACGGSGGDAFPVSNNVPGVDNSPTPPQGTTPPPTVDGELPRVDLRGFDDLYPYRASSPFAGVLKACALAGSEEEACTLETLPFITQATPAFTREDIMDRLLVTHDWMGARFETLLNDAPNLMIPLFGSITSISMGSDIRPSSYNVLRGAIRLDPFSHWLTTAEKATISIQDDFRSDFGADLQFLTFNSLRRDGRRVTSSASLTDYNERTLDQIKMPVYQLWFHELAHAVDFLPDSSVPTLINSLTPSRALFRNRQHYLSPKLYNDLPLYSNVLYELGQVNYRGEDATEQQKNFTAGDVGAEMANDGAMKFYGYSTEREDFATLFANAMMKQSFNVDHYNAFIEKPLNIDDSSCSELIVGWGVRNRLADPLVSVRAQWTLEQIYGSNASLDTFFSANLGQPSSMTPGVDWCTNVAPVPASDTIAATARSTKSVADDADELRHLQIQIKASRRNIGH